MNSGINQWYPGELILHGVQLIVQDVSDAEYKSLLKIFIFNNSVAFIIFRVGHPSPLSHSRDFPHITFQKEWKGGTRVGGEREGNTDLRDTHQSDVYCTCSYWG